MNTTEISMPLNERAAAKKLEYTLMFQSGLAGARATAQDPSLSELDRAAGQIQQDFYAGAVAAMEGRRAVSQEFLNMNAEACMRGATFNKGHEEGQLYLVEALCLDPAFKDLFEQYLATQKR